MLATIADDIVIFDRNVADLFGIPSSALPRRDWLPEALRRYEGIRRGIQAFTQTPVWQEMRALLSEIPQGRPSLGNPKSRPHYLGRLQVVTDRRRTQALLWLEWGSSNAPTITSYFGGGPERAQSYTSRLCAIRVTLTSFAPSSMRYKIRQSPTRMRQRSL